MCFRKMKEGEIDVEGRKRRREDRGEADGEGGVDAGSNHNTARSWSSMRGEGRAAPRRRERKFDQEEEVVAR